MVNDQPAAVSAPGPGRDTAEIAERVAARSARRGIGREELAARAGMDPHYLRYLLETGPAFDPAGFVRIAAALGTSYRELVDGPSDPPLGRTKAGAHPVLVHLTEEECWDRLDGHGIGRIALPASPGPLVLPVNYTVDGRTVAYRTDPHGAAAPDPGTAVSFQVDRIDETLSRGWSVLVVGAAEPVEDAEAVRRLEAVHPPAPWAGGARPLWVRVAPRQVTGRRIAVA
jgi:nitroimidazol reductase NimA-like FMN-containing flavoprotein (pyridoxamine 5'-phosphate oxidase superfamily)